PHTVRGCRRRCWSRGAEVHHPVLVGLPLQPGEPRRPVGAPLVADAGDRLVVRRALVGLSVIVTGEVRVSILTHSTWYVACAGCASCNAAFGRSTTFSISSVPPSRSSPTRIGWAGGV